MIRRPAVSNQKVFPLTLFASDRMYRCPVRTALCSSRASCSLLPGSLLASLGYEDLNSIAEDYTYKVCKQAYRIIDLMVACGELSFSDGNRLSKSIESCMKDGGFLIVYKPCKQS